MNPLPAWTTRPSSNQVIDEAVVSRTSFAVHSEADGLGNEVMEDQQCLFLNKTGGYSDKGIDMENELTISARVSELEKQNGELVKEL